MVLKSLKKTLQARRRFIVCNHDLYLYLECDVILLADLFGKFRGNNSLKKL